MKMGPHVLSYGMNKLRRSGGERLRLPKQSITPRTRKIHIRRATKIFARRAANYTSDISYLADLMQCVPAPAPQNSDTLSGVNLCTPDQEGKGVSVRAGGSNHILRNCIRGIFSSAQISSTTCVPAAFFICVSDQGVATFLTVIFASDAKNFTHGPGIDEPLILHTHNFGEDTWTCDYYIADALGSIHDIIARDGSVKGEFVYNSFGKIVSSSGIALQQPYSFTAREFDEETDLYFYRARYYDPQVGRFLQEDPLIKQRLLYPEILDGSNRSFATEISQSGSNIVFIKSRFLEELTLTRPDLFYLYVYAANQPMKYTDPTGLFLLGGLGGILMSVAIGMILRGKNYWRMFYIGGAFVALDIVWGPEDAFIVNRFRKAINFIFDGKNQQLDEILNYE